MSDQPSTASPARPVNAQALRDTRWLAAGIWAGLLAALLVTSTAAVEAFTQGSIASRYLTVSNVGDNSSSNTLAISGLILSGVTAAALLGAWFGFVRATRSLVFAYSDAGSSDDEEPAPSEWVSEAPSVDSAAAVFRAVPADLLVFIGVAWVAIVMTPAVLGAVQAFAD